MFKKIAVGDVMTRKFISVKPSTNLLQCSKEFVKQRVNGLLVTDSKRLCGIITQRDILWAITKKPSLDLKKVKSIDVASRKVAVIKPSANLLEAFDKMKKYGFRRLPVVTKGEIVGLLTLKDILAIDPTYYSESRELFTIREESEKLKKIAEDESQTEGLCEECGAFADLLKVEGKFRCTDCRNDLY